jgi:hypothetical protein
METNSQTNVLQTKQDKLKELHAQQEKLKELQAELDVIESKINKNEKLSEKDTKFVGELGWLSAAAVTIAAIASSV